MIICYRRYCMLILGLFLFLMSAACQHRSKEDLKPLPPLPQASADKFFIVDCLLPGEVRKLGTSVTYLTPRRPVKTAALDCEIRGGEYVAYDRSNYTTALEVWLPKAEEGDMAAQNYVGKIYESGLGREPDYTLTAKWYQKAAEKGDSNAQISLGRLYEKGLGVSQDKVKALYWYRKAYGLGENIDLAPEVEELKRLHQKELDQLKQEIQTLRGKLEKTQQELEQNRQNLKHRTDETETEKLKLKQLQQMIARTEQELKTRNVLKSKYEQQQLLLQRQEQKIQQLYQEIASQEKEAKTYKQKLSALEETVRKGSEGVDLDRPQEKISLSPHIFGNYHALLIGNNDYKRVLQQFAQS